MRRGLPLFDEVATVREGSWWKRNGASRHKFQEEGNRRRGREERSVEKADN